MADKSMSVAVAKIARQYSKDKGISVGASFASQDTQEMDIAEGDAVDILITSRKQWIEKLKTRGLVDIYSQTPVARHQLALVGPSDSPVKAKIAENGFPVTALIHQFGDEPSFVVGNPESLQLGIYGKEVLRKLGVAADLEPYTVYVKRLDDMFDMVTKHGAYGIFYYASTLSRSGMRVIDILPEGSHRPITCYAVVIAGDKMDEARKFLEYLKGNEAKRIFRDNGFIVD